jgi:hypothetical protein
MTFERVLGETAWRAHASDLPDVLRAAVTGSQAAFGRLFREVYAEGWVHDTAPDVVRALLAALAEAPLDAVFARSAILFLDCCATSRDRDGLGYVPRCRRAIVDEAAAVVRWLDADDEYTRIHAVTLASVVPLPGAAERALARFAAEPSVYVQLASVAVLATAPADAIAALRAGATDRTVALGLALAESGARGAPVDALVRATVEDWLGLLWSLGSPDVAPIEVLRTLRPEDACPALVAAAAALVEIDSGKSVERHARAICEIALREQPAFDPAAVSADERALLARLVDAEAVWRSDTPWMAIVRRWGIRDKTRDVREFLASALAITPRTVVVLLRPRDVPRAAALCARFGEPAWVDGTFAFFRGDPAVLDPALGAPPEPDRRLVDVAGRLQSACVTDVTPTAIRRFRFYPDESLDVIAEIASAAGADVRLVPSDAGG